MSDTLELSESMEMSSDCTDQSSSSSESSIRCVVDLSGVGVSHEGDAVWATGGVGGVDSDWIMISGVQIYP